MERTIACLKPYAVTRKCTKDHKKCQVSGNKKDNLNFLTIATKSLIVWMTTYIPKREKCFHQLKKKKARRALQHHYHKVLPVKGHAKRNT